ncbi:MAG: hypothetical protein PVF17_01000 [Ignavibacteria bacterium]|jgi:hypothetical protein
MAGTKVSNYAIGDENIEEMQLTIDKAYKGKCSLTISELNTTTQPVIEAGSWIDNNGALYKFDSNETISTTDPVTSSTVADGTVYICLIPDSGTASGATTDASGYSIGATSITLASAGTGDILTGDNIRFAGDTNLYTVASGDADVSNGGTITLESPGLKQAIPSSATGINMVGGSITASFTATPPTFSNTKQGWYGTGSQANYRYLNYIMVKSGTTYDNKYAVDDQLFSKSICVVSKSATSTYSSIGYFSIDFDQKIYDIKNEYNLGSDFFQPIQAGLYRISMQIGWSPAGDAGIFHIGIALGGVPSSVTSSSIIVQSTLNNSDSVAVVQEVSLERLIFLKTTDSVYPYIYDSTTGTGRIYGDTTGTNITMFQVERVA